MGEYYAKGRVKGVSHS